MMVLLRFRSSLGLFVVASIDVANEKSVLEFSDLLGGTFVVIQRRRFRSVESRAAIGENGPSGARRSARDDIFSGATLLPPQINAT